MSEQALSFPSPTSISRKKKLFNEFYEVSKQSADLITKARNSGTPVIAVGTTALRAIESAARPSSPLTAPWKIEETNAFCPTDIFIYPPYDFKIADGLITNFHVPRSSLMLLVVAFLKHKHAKRDILALYEVAIKNDFRFYSFGDGMLII